MTARRLRDYTAWYFRYYAASNQDEMSDGGVQSKKLRAYDFDDAEARWWKQNPAGDIYRDLFQIEENSTGRIWNRSDNTIDEPKKE